VAPSTPIPPLCAVDARGSLDANLGPPGVHDQHRSAGIRVTTCLGGKKQGKYYASLQRQIRTCRWSDAGGGVARGVRAWGRFFSFLFFLVSFLFLIYFYLFIVSFFLFIFFIYFYFSVFFLFFFLFLFFIYISLLFQFHFSFLLYFFYFSYFTFISLFFLFIFYFLLYFSISIFIFFPF
jgi:hypothetical protein